MKKFFVYLLACTMIIGIVGCAAKSESVQETQAIAETAVEAVVENVTEEPTTQAMRTDFTIGFCGVTLNDEYHVILANAVKKACKDKGVECKIQAGTEYASVDEQSAIIESYIAEGVDGIILAPASSQGLNQALQDCISANIPIINLDTKISDETLQAIGQDISFYGTDNYVGGQLIGKFFKEQFPEDGTKVAILRGVNGQLNDDDRYNGFINKAGNIDVKFVQHADWETDKAYTAIQSCLKENSDLQAIYCENDSMGLGAFKAVDEAGKKDQIKIFSYEGTATGLEAVVDGSFVSTCAQQPIEMGKLGVENMLKVLNGRQAENYIDTGCKLVTAENATEVLKTIKEYMSEIIPNDNVALKTIAEETVETTEEIVEETVETIEETDAESVEETTLEEIETEEAAEETGVIEETTLNEQ